MKKAKLLWIDLEMTGLSPVDDRILEVACIGTDWDLVPVCEYTGVVKVDAELMERRMVGDFWDKNSESRDGLIEQNKDGKPVEKIEKEILAFLDENFAKESIDGDPKGKHKIILAGNSIHQDKRFIENEMPELAQKLHYRMLDVSAWKVWFEGTGKQRFLKQEAHRALDDIRGSIEELKYYIGFIK